MGIESMPLFATPDTALVHLDKLTPETFKFIENYCDFEYVRQDNGEIHSLILQKNTLNIDEFIQTIPPYTKIYGYMTDDFWIGWGNLLKEISSMNPDIPRIELHFYCTDEQMAYSFVIQDNVCWYYSYTYEQTKSNFFVPIPDEEKEVDDEGNYYPDAETERFDLLKYKSNYKNIACSSKSFDEMYEHSKVMYQHKDLLLNLLFSRRI